MDLARSKQALQNMRGILNDQTIDFFSGLWDVQETIVPLNWRASNPNIPWGEKPLFAQEAPQMTEDEFYAALVPISTYIGGAVLEFSLAAEKIAGPNRPSIPTDALNGMFANPSIVISIIAGRLGIPQESNAQTSLELAVVSALQPTAIAAAATFATPENTMYVSGCCPVCGSPSSLGTIKDAGEMNGGPKELWCSFCDTTWTHPRIQCTRCGNNTQEDLTFSFEENDVNHRIYHCAKCHGTHKIVDEKPLMEPFDRRATDIAMTPLEVAAIEALNASTPTK